MFHFITVVDDYATWAEGPIEDIDVALRRYREEVESPLHRIANAIQLDCFAIEDPEMPFDRDLKDRPQELSFLDKPGA